MRQTFQKKDCGLWPSICEPHVHFIPQLSPSICLLIITHKMLPARFRFCNLGAASQNPSRGTTRFFPSLGLITLFPIFRSCNAVMLETSIHQVIGLKQFENIYEISSNHLKAMSCGPTIFIGANA